VSAEDIRFDQKNAFKSGIFNPELPKDKKPTHIIVGAGAAGCVLVSLIFSILNLRFRQID
jgi:hypothetical protein